MAKETTQLLCLSHKYFTESDFAGVKWSKLSVPTPSDTTAETAEAAPSSPYASAGQSIIIGDCTALIRCRVRIFARSDHREAKIATQSEDIEIQQWLGGVYVWRRASRLQGPDDGCDRMS